MKKDKNEAEKFEFTETQYVRLILLIFCETLTVLIVFVGLTEFRDQISPAINFIGYFAFFTSIVFLQMPFLAFLTEDFIPKRLKVIRMIMLWVTRIILLAVILSGIVLAYILLGTNAATGGLLIAVITIILSNWRKIESIWKKK